MEFLQTLFASAAILWGTIIAFVLTIAILLENEREGWATTITSIGLALVLWLNKDVALDFIKSHPSQILGFAGAYILLGIGWSVLKWQLYVKKAFLGLKTLKADFIRENGPITDENRAIFNKKVAVSDDIKKAGSGYSVSTSDKTSLEDIVNQVAPLASKKKSIITSWISYWPISLTATLLNNPFRKFFEWLYEQVSGVYEVITTSNKKSILHD